MLAKQEPTNPASLDVISCPGDDDVESEMTQPAKVQEPSMEEILASIRRIIADDEAKPAEKANGPAAPPRSETPPPAAKPSVMRDAPPSAASAQSRARPAIADPPLKESNS